MSGGLMSREAIARSADAAAADWVAQPQRQQPVNPFCEQDEPEHHAEWRASFQRSLLAHSADECSELSA